MAIKYTVNEERANTLTHLLGVLIVFFASIYFALNPHNSIINVSYFVGIFLYLLGAGSSYISSSLYHSSPQTSERREKLRRLDHAAIYWHIAGSYSPIMLSGMSERQEWGWGLFAIVWLCAIIGSFVSFKGLKEHSNLETICFVAMGFVLFLAFNDVLYCIGWTSMYWIIAEGVAFVIGAIFYSFNKVPYMHTTFHVFVLLGTLCHIVALYLIL